MIMLQSYGSFSACSKGDGSLDKFLCHVVETCKQSNACEVPVFASDDICISHFYWVLTKLRVDNFYQSPARGRKRWITSFTCCLDNNTNFCYLCAGERSSIYQYSSISTVLFFTINTLACCRSTLVARYSLCFHQKKSSPVRTQSSKV